MWQDVLEHALPRHELEGRRSAAGGEKLEEFLANAFGRHPSEAFLQPHAALQAWLFAPRTAIMRRSAAKPQKPQEFFLDARFGIADELRPACQDIPLSIYGIEDFSIS